MSERTILGGLLTLNEAQRYVQAGELPDDFRQRVGNGLEFDPCSNCDNRKCMGCVFREYDHECSENQCPFCDEVERRQW